MLITKIRSEEPEVRTAPSTAEEAEELLDQGVLDFAAGIPGFPACRRFRLEQLAPELEPFCVMRSVDTPEISFVLVPPGVFFADYSVEIDEQHVARLGLESSDDAVVLVIVTLGDPPTVNLLGPLVVNRHTRSGAQVVQYQADYRAAEPLVPPPGA